MRKLALCLLVLVVLAACGERGRDADSGGSLRPGEKNERMSAKATAGVGACARESGWHFQDLRVLVDSEGVLIRVSFNAQKLSPDAPPEAEVAEVVDRCLTRAEVRRPPIGS
jgi:hypothetical protein